MLGSNCTNTHGNSTTETQGPSSGQPCLAIGLHRLFQTASFGGKDALYRKTTLFQEIGERCIFTRILLDKLAVNLDHTLREVEVAEVVDTLALRDLPRAITLLDLPIRMEPSTKSTARPSNHDISMVPSG